MLLLKLKVDFKKMSFCVLFINSLSSGLYKSASILTSVYSLSLHSRVLFIFFCSLHLKTACLCVCVFVYVCMHKCIYLLSCYLSLLDLWFVSVINFVKFIAIIYSNNLSAPLYLSFNFWICYCIYIES